METLFNAHLARIQTIIQEALSSCRLDGVWIYAGQADYYFVDDQTKSFILTRISIMLCRCLKLKEAGCF